MMTSSTNKSLWKSKDKSLSYFQGSGDSSEVSEPVRQITIRYITEVRKLQRGYTVYMILWIFLHRSNKTVLTCMSINVHKIIDFLPYTSHFQLPYFSLIYQYRTITSSIAVFLCEEMIFQHTKTNSCNIRARYVMFSLKSNANYRCLTWRINSHKYLLRGGQPVDRACAGSRRPVPHTTPFIYVDLHKHSSSKLLSIYATLCQDHVWGVRCLGYDSHCLYRPSPLYATGTVLHFRQAFKTFPHFSSIFLFYLSDMTNWLGLRHIFRLPATNIILVTADLIGRFYVFPRALHRNC
jgi:hypothetical protein